MQSRVLTTTLGALASAALLLSASGAIAGPHSFVDDRYQEDGFRHRHHPQLHGLPYADQNADQRYGVTSRQHGRSGYVINRQGFGNYVRGPDGSFGGYPLNSPGAQILQRQQEKKCQNVPESC